MCTDIGTLTALPSAGHCVFLRETEQQGETLRTLPKDKPQGSNSSVESELTLWDVASSWETLATDFSSSASPTVSPSKAGALGSVIWLDPTLLRRGMGADRIQISHKSSADSGTQMALFLVSGDPKLTRKKAPVPSVLLSAFLNIKS